MDSARALIARGWGVSLVSRCLRVSRAQLHVILRRTDDWMDGRRSRHTDDTDVLLRIHHVIGELPTYGYRRVWALLRRQAELTQKKTHKANIEISLDEFKFMLMLENNYHEFKRLNQWVLKPISKDLNTYSNMKLVVDKRGRPTDTLIFRVGSLTAAACHGLKLPL
ncbi:insertion element IS2 transposase InsD [Escherichia coli]|nr:insertion element IS2 transposase InsD [Escherichia coli]